MEMLGRNAALGIATIMAKAWSRTMNKPWSGFASRLSGDMRLHKLPLVFATRMDGVSKKNQKRLSNGIGRRLIREMQMGSSG